MSILKGRHIISKPDISGVMESRRTLTIVLLSLMSLILISSLGAVILFYEGPTIEDDQDKPDSRKGYLNIEITESPSYFRSDMAETVKGKVTDEENNPVEGASVSIDFPYLEMEQYKARSMSDGSFTLDFWTPTIEDPDTYDFQLTAFKDGYSNGQLEYTKLIQLPPTWTFMIYMSDCDLESWALADINEMESIPDSPFLNIVVQLDRWESISPKDDTTNGNWTTTKRLEIQYDEDPLSLGSREIEDIGEINSADPDELTDFIRFAKENYPADNYALILWNHGSGIDGICWEQSTEEEQVISVNGLGNALDEATDNGHDPLDLIGFDACLMSTIEVAYEIAPYGSRLLASEITEPNFGWDYSSLAHLISDPFMKVDQVGSILIDDYIEQSFTLSSKRSMSLYLVNLSQIDNVVDDLDALSNTINSAGPSEVYNMRLARKYSQPISQGTSSEAVDLFDYTSNIKDLTSNSMIKEDCDDLLGSIERAVISGDKRKGIGDIETEGLKGLSIFSPDFKEIFTSKESYDDLKFAEDTTWSETLMKLYENMELEMQERVLSFDVELLSCRISDEDGDCLPDTMEYEFTIGSTSNTTQSCFLGVNVYDLRGMYIDSTWTNLSLDPLSSSKIKITFYPEGEDAESGLYRIAAYLCLGHDFDPLSLQDYTRSGYRWLEVRN